MERLMIAIVVGLMVAVLAGVGTNQVRHMMKAGDGVQAWEMTPTLSMFLVMSVVWYIAIQQV